MVLESVADTEGDQDTTRLAGAAMAIQARVRVRARARARAKARARARARARGRVTCVDIGALSDDLVRVRGSG